MKRVRGGGGGGIWGIGAHIYTTHYTSFGTLTVDDIINGTRFYTEDENDQYIRSYLTSDDGPRFRIDG
jgi:hypothetical protein